MNEPRYTPLAASLPATVPFVGPETQERARGREFLARIGANENVFGPSPKAIKAMQAAAYETWKYADAENFELKRALAAHHQVEPENIIVGNGIDGLLGSLVRLMVGPGDAVVTSNGAYPTFNYHVNGFGGQLHTVAFSGDSEDPVGLIAKAGAVDAKLIYLANPDNPMGSWQSSTAVQQMIEAVPKGSLLVLDEAYIEFAPKDTAPKIDADDLRVIRFRTFSKAYGMAGARVGYGIAHADLIRSFNKVRDHFGMSKISQIGALVALEDQDYLGEVLNKVATAKARIGEIAAENGLVALPSATNFVTIDCGQGGAFAKAVLGNLLERDIFVRMPFVAPQDRCIRISAGQPHELDLLAAALPLALEAAR